MTINAIVAKADRQFVGQPSSDLKSIGRSVSRVHLILRNFCTMLTTLLAFYVMFALPSSARETGDQNGPGSLATLASALQDAVVNISTSQKIKGARGIRPPKVPKGSPFEDFFKDFFDEKNKKGRTRRISSLGSGFVIDPSGLVVTNNHVIKGADEIFINFTDGTKLKVDKVLGYDSKTDLALLKVTPKKPLKFVTFGSSAKARVGDWVMAIGNPFGLGGTVTVGIVSAKKRDINSGPYDEFIQTDAAINKGNSGGPLFNMSGQVIGVNTAIISPSGGSIGIGFSVPSDTVVYIVNQLKKYGEIRRGWLGVRIQTVTPEIADSLGLSDAAGALVAKVLEKSPAKAAGIEAGDIILKFDGQQVKTMRSLPKIVALTAIDKDVNVELLRKGKQMTVTVKIARLDDEITPIIAAEKKKQPSDDNQDIEILGLTLSSLTDDLRKRYSLSKNIKGVVITKVESTSRAAEKNIRAGHVLVEVMQEEVSSPGDAEKKIKGAQSSARKSVLFLISDPKGELRFVAVPFKKAG